MSAKLPFTEDQFWKKLRCVPGKMGAAVVERGVMLYVILTDRETPAWARVLALAALVYLMNPYDAIPDAIRSLPWPSTRAQAFTTCKSCWGMLQVK